MNGDDLITRQIGSVPICAALRSANNDDGRIWMEIGGIRFDALRRRRQSRCRFEGRRMKSFARRVSSTHVK